MSRTREAGLTRRALLQTLGLGAGAALFPSLARAQRRPVRLPIRPVKVARERVLRTIVGLRPFRPTGFVVRAEKLGAQTIVHNYGHGGCGVTLSWGTAELAVAEVLRTGEKKIAVLGAGAVGLATARLLQERGLAATIYARELPPGTTSDIAGARWYPFDLFDKDVVSPDFIALVWRVSRVAYDRFRKMMGDEYGIHSRATYACRNSPFPKESLLNFDSPVHEMLPGMRDLIEAEHPFPYPRVRVFQTLMIEPAIYLPAMMRDVRRAGGEIVVRDFKGPAEIAALAERVVVNCTGLGAGALFGDAELMPIKGQLTILTPQAEVDYLALPANLYMFPRKDGIVLGGTFERGIWTMDPNLEAEERILAGHAKFFGAFRG